MRKNTTQQQRLRNKAKPTSLRKQKGNKSASNGSESFMKEIGKAVLRWAIVEVVKHAIEFFTG